MLIGKGPGLFGGSVIQGFGHDTKEPIVSSHFRIRRKQSQQTASTIGKIIDCRSYRTVTFTYEVNDEVYVKTIHKIPRESYSKNQLIKVYYDPEHPKNASFVRL